MSNFIHEYLKYAEEVESPDSFLYWSALATLAAVMRDNIYYDVGVGRIYPNIYVILVAKSSILRKGTPLNISESLMEEVHNTKIIAGRASMQAILRRLAEAESVGHGVLKGASCLLYSEELASFIVEDPATIPLLTDWYDYHKTWTNMLVGGGISQLNNVCVTLLAGSNQHFLKTIFTNHAVYGGLLARTFLVTGEKRRRINSRTKIDSKKYEKHRKPIIDHLKRLAGINCKVDFSDKAALIYDEWYHSISDEKYANSVTGVEGRMHTGAMKVAMCLAASDMNLSQLGVLIMDEEHVVNAIDEVIKLLKNYTILATGSGAAEIGKSMDFVLTILLEAPNYAMERTTLIRRLMGNVDVDTLDKVIVNFTQAQYITETMVGKYPGYVLTDKCVEDYKKTLMERKK